MRQHQHNPILYYCTVINNYLLEYILYFSFNFLLNLFIKMHYLQLVTNLIKTGILKALDYNLVFSASGSERRPWSDRRCWICWTPCKHLHLQIPQLIFCVRSAQIQSITCAAS